MAELVYRYTRVLYVPSTEDAANNLCVSLDLPTQICRQFHCADTNAFERVKLGSPEKRVAVPTVRGHEHRHRQRGITRMRPYKTTSSDWETSSSHRVTLTRPDSTSRPGSRFRARRHPGIMLTSRPYFSALIPTTYATGGFSKTK